MFSQRRQRGKGRPDMAKPSVRAVDHGHTPCRSGRPWPAPLQGRPAAAKAVGAAASKRRLCKLRLPAANPAASRGGGADHKGGRPLAGRLLATRAITACAGAATATAQ
ncbi:hypothetical protein B296_00021075 [Ensete ventricosum]|uniref:Uncharacterized protein n=1 Tax=Ensete ventricosum TaxID=4639 RepID=A0A426X5Y7_ENSVE|nr:hypothetical protein B296_00021075 [Ensete ventricosum]